MHNLHIGSLSDFIMARISQKRLAVVVAIGIIAVNIGSIFYGLYYPQLYIYARDYHREPYTGTYVYYLDSSEYYEDHWDTIYDDLEDMANVILLSAKATSLDQGANMPFDETALQRIKNMESNITSRNMQVIIHLYCTHAIPTWVEENSTEAYVKNGYRIQYPPDDWTYWSYMENYTRFVANFFKDTDMIMGYCMADEPNTIQYAELLGNMSDWIKDEDPQAQTTVMLNEVDFYETYEPFCDFFSVDPYQDDQDFARSLKRARDVTDKKLIVLQSGMGDDDNLMYMRMRRQAWIAWFMGADQIWFWSYNIYWESGMRQDEVNTWHVCRWDSINNQTIRTSKGDAAVEIKRDVLLLSQIDGYLFNETGDPAIKSNINELQIRAYRYVMNNNFLKARLLITEAVMILNGISNYGNTGGL